jgi:hypothetical protein
MSQQAIHFWAACEKAIFEANVRIRGGKSYYSFHGGEAIYADSVGEVVRHCAEDMDRDWMIFEFVPLPSSMVKALWASQHDEPIEDRTFDVRVHAKFTFPTSDRGGVMTATSAPIVIPEAEDDLVPV